MKTVSKKLLSLLLVAVLLVSAVPFQAFADPHDPAHTLSPWWNDPSLPGVHYKVCLAGTGVCDSHGQVIESEPHTYSGNVCTVCGFTCTHPTTQADPSTAVTVTCVTDGKEADIKCVDCGTVITAGAVIPATGHNFSGGSCTNCGATDPNGHQSTHAYTAYQYNSTVHWKECAVPTCTDAIAHTHFDEVAHTYGANGICTVCGYQCQHTGGFTDKPGTYVAPTCVTPGKAADQYCATCGFVHSEGAVIAATGMHTWDANGNCTVCSARRPESSYVLTLDPNQGTVNSGVSLSISVTKNRPVGNLPTPVRTGFNFLGWFIGDTQIFSNQDYPYDSNMTAVAKWSDKVQVLTVRRVFNGNLSTAKTIYTANVAEGTQLLTYLQNNVGKSVTDEEALNPGYKWDKFWRDFSGNQALTGQEVVMDQAQTVYVNFVSSTYTLNFNANGGIVTPQTKTVSFGSPIGTLPTPYREGFVFLGWKDSSGNIVTADTIYNVASDTSLTAQWQDEALVILYIYINGDFTTCNRMIVMDGFVKNNNISRADVVGEVSKYYTTASGTLKIAGLFDQYTWSSYRANTNKAGTDNIQITADRPNKIYVMVSNANTGSTVLPTTPTNPTVPANGFWVRDLNGNLVWYPAGSSLPAGSGYWVLDSNGNPNIWVMTNGSYIPTYIYTGTNPKTGDTAQLEIAAAVMVLAAAALITIMALRKKKSV